ncbi:helix-hairpin-helix domain-containing protein [Pseudoalteromonas shioyasakiensis]|uniref:ComEA family DNA-binding protein n=1 Tax=Pseudoalteromonas shioyasakiensis TaxID=1190813 RepID=UPI002118CD60|nr:helix-hairpin-helix domain-containing protein [Pseudoalteromonas shioyasakiensis]MCQ8877851.1 helix-hairpin-helix domain-containing protein [Pseudoalteromonas shioyasakiensis]
MKLLSALAVLAGLVMISPSYAVDSKATTPSKVVEKAQVINLNKASVEQLMQLSGIGQSKAQAIVDYRAKHGNFKSVADLAQVKGIGDKLLAKLEGKVSL